MLDKIKRWFKGNPEPPVVEPTSDRERIIAVGRALGKAIGSSGGLDTTKLFLVVGVVAGEAIAICGRELGGEWLSDVCQTLGLSKKEAHDAFAAGLAMPPQRRDGLRRAATDLRAEIAPPLQAICAQAPHKELLQLSAAMELLRYVSEKLEAAGDAEYRLHRPRLITDMIGIAATTSQRERAARM